MLDDKFQIHLDGLEEEPEEYGEYDEPIFTGVSFFAHTPLLNDDGSVLDALPGNVPIALSITFTGVDDVDPGVLISVEDARKLADGILTWLGGE